MWRNNPIDIAISEARVLFPTITEPDVVLSLGTGYHVAKDVYMSDAFPAEATPLSSSPTITDSGGVNIGMATALQQPRGLWRSGFITRCLESFMSTMDGQKFYDLPNQWNRTAEGNEKRYFRLNVKLEGKTPALDDVSTMCPLKAATTKQHLESKSLEELAECLISTLFYFELISRPVRNRDHISCHGRILCIIGPGHNGNSDTLSKLLNTLTQQGSKFFVSHRPLPGVVNSPANIDPATKRFQIKVDLQVRDLDSAIPICLRIGDTNHSISRHRSISASPFTLNGLTASQGWDCHFGRADHGPTEPESITELVEIGRAHV